MASDKMQYDRLMVVLDERDAQAGETIAEAKAAGRSASCREINDRISGLEGEWRSGEPLGFVCECSDTVCASPLYLTADEYREVRTNPGHFVSVPEHVDDKRQRVVRSGERYAVVELREQR